MTCGVGALMLVAGGGHYNPPEYEGASYNRCIREEMTMTKHNHDHNRNPYHVPVRNRVAFGAVLSVALANALAALRDASRAAPVLADATVLLTPFLQGRSVSQRYRQIFNGTEDDNFNLCNETLPLIEKCRPEWKRFLYNVAERTYSVMEWSWYFTVTVGGGAAVAAFFNAALLAAVGAIFGTAAAVIGHPVAITYLVMVTGVGAFFGWIIGLLDCSFGNGWCPDNINQRDWECDPEGESVDENGGGWRDTLRSFIPPKRRWWLELR